jgi:hypothetical protein
MAFLLYSTQDCVQVGQRGEYSGHQQQPVAEALGGQEWQQRGQQQRHIASSSGNAVVEQVDGAQMAWEQASSRPSRRSGLLPWWKKTLVLPRVAAGGQRTGGIGAAGSSVEGALSSSRRQLLACSRTSKSGPPSRCVSACWRSEQARTYVSADPTDVDGGKANQ